MDYIVDLQGFKQSLNGFTFKEVAILPLQEKDAVPIVFLFKPPFTWNNLQYKYQNENKWLIYNYHGIPWDSGKIPYDDVKETLQNQLHNARNIYVKGVEKKRWLKNILGNRIHNFEDFGCPALKRLRVNSYCNHHTLCTQPVCAAMNVKALKNWFLNCSF